MKTKLSLVLMGLLLTLLIACGGAAPAVEQEAQVEEPAAAVVEEAAEEEMAEAMTEEEMAEAALPTIAQIAAGDENFSTLVTALQAADLVETLASEGDFTVFAPTNDAFAALPEGTVEALLEDPSGALTQVLLYHVVEGTVMAETVVGLDMATTLQGEGITIEVIDGSVFLNETVQVTMTDIQASNGVVHVIDGVILPPSMMVDATPSIAEIAAADENFSTLVTALDAAGLVGTLADEGEFTVFAPTNDAFAAMPEGTVEALLEDPEGALTDVLLYHVLQGVFLAETVVSLDAAPTLQGEEITISIEDGAVILNDVVNVVTTDIKASNGVIHVIDAVILPPSMMAAEEGEMTAEVMPTIAEIAASNEDFSTLVAALDAAGLVKTLDSDGKFTVFAPTNDAFAALPAGTVESLLEDPNGALTQVLLYHVVDGAVSAEMVVGLDTAATLQGEDITISVVDGSVFLNDTIQVITTDIMASNGIIHVIEGVLVPAQ